MTVPPPPPRRGPLRALITTPTGRIALILLALLALAVALGPTIAGDAASIGDPLNARQDASWAHPLGTDDLGRDVLARVVTATQLTLALAVAAVALGAGLGYALGLVAALTGGRVRRCVLLVLSLWLAFPPVVVALFVSAVLAQTTTGAVVAIALAFVPLYARTMLNQANGVVNQDFIHVARMLGVSRRRRLTRHIAPNVSSPLWIQTTTGIGEAMVTLSALSFIGLGVQSPQYDWGSLLAEYLDRIFTDPLVVLGPAAAITIVGIVFAFIGEAGALVMDPRRWTSGRIADRSASLPVRPVEGNRPGKPSDDALLVIDGLRVWFDDPGQARPVVDDVSLSVAAGETVGIIGESGSGKSITASAITRLVPEPGVVDARRIALEGIDVLGEMTPELRRHLGTRVATVFQNPMAALTPTVRIGKQMTEATRFHTGVSKTEARARALTALGEVRIPDPTKVFDLYPHQLSGGMRQRVVLAMGLMTRPALLIADEPTTALDVTVQKQILELLAQIQQDHRMGIVFISHDFGVIREICDRVLVMLHGRVVEELDVDDLDHAQHPYTQELLAAVPRLDSDQMVSTSIVPSREEEAR